MLKAWFREDPVGSYWVLALFFFSLLVWLLVILFDLGQPPTGLPESFLFENHVQTFEEVTYRFGYRTYWEKANWFAFPLFFLLVGPVVYLSWVPFLRAWREEGVAEPIVRDKDNFPPSEGVREKLLREMGLHRRWFVVVALLASSLVNYLDTAEVREAYYGTNFAIQLQAACGDPDFHTRWVFARESELRKQKDWTAFQNCEEIRYKEAIPEAVLREKNESDLKSIAEKLLNERRSMTRQKAPVIDVVFTVFTYFQQFNIAALGFLILFQMIAQAVYFAIFPALKSARQAGLSIRYDIRARFGDYGLTRWNLAIDHQFFALLLPLIIPWISRFSQPKGASDIGQVMIGMTIWSLAVVPWVLNLLARLRWRSEAILRSIAAPQGEELPAQDVWPFEKGWQSFSKRLALLLALSLISTTLTPAGLLEKVLNLLIGG